MGKRRAKQQNVPVIGLFNLAGVHKKMDDVFVYHKCQSTLWNHSAKIKTNKLNHKDFSHVPFSMFVCFLSAFVYVLSSCSF